MTESARKARFLFFIGFYAAALIWFYIRYVPLVPSFQWVLAPVLTVVAAAAAVKPRWGVYLFVFFFPLINNLPYFFHIYEHIPHAPTALVLFLFFFLGWLLHRLRVPRDDVLRLRIFIPMALFSILVVISALITVWRYTNFCPLLSDRFFELAVNVNGVSAGGAIMSAVFTGLNYLTGFAFFYILLGVMKTEELRHRILFILLTSTSIAITFGLRQAFVDKMMGNTPGRVTMNTVNATLLDPNALGGFLAAVLPLSFAAAFVLPAKYRAFPLLVCVAGIVLLPFSGSISGLLTLFIGLFFILSALGRYILTQSPIEKRKRLLIISGVLFLLLASSVGGTLFLSKHSATLDKVRRRLSGFATGRRLDALTDSRLSYFWRIAAEITADYPATGVGMGSYIIETPNYSARLGYPWRQGDSAQNYFAQSAAELGLPGLLLSLWIWLEIFRQIRRRLKRRDLPLAAAMLSAGTAAAVTVLFLNFQVHTYIGSFDVKYLFWLMTACLFSPEVRPPERPDATGAKPRRLLFPALAAVLIFGGMHLWNSLHSLSLEARTSELGIHQEFGLHEPEVIPGGRTLRWSGAVAGISLPAGGKVLVLPVLASHPDIRKRPVYVNFILYRDFFRRKILLARIKIEHNRWQTLRLRLPLDLGDQAMLVFEVSRTWSPLRELGIQDARRLGIALGEIFRTGEPPSRKNPSSD